MLGMGIRWTCDREEWWCLRGPQLACLALPNPEHQGLRGQLLRTLIIPFVGLYIVPLLAFHSSVLTFLPPIHTFPVPLIFFSWRWFPGSSLRWIMGSTSPDLLPTLHTSSVLWPGLPACVLLSGLLRWSCGGSLSPCELWAEPGRSTGGVRT